MFGGCQVMVPEDEEALGICWLVVNDVALGTSTFLKRVALMVGVLTTTTKNKTKGHKQTCR